MGWGGVEEVKNIYRMANKIELRERTSSRCESLSFTPVAIRMNNMPSSRNG